MIKRVLFVDDDADLRDSLEDILQSRYQVECSTYANYTDLVEAGPAALDHQLAILDINLGHGAPTGIDAYQWLRRLGFKGGILFLTGHARSHPEVAKAKKLEDAQIAQKPMGLETLDRFLGETRAG